MNNALIIEDDEFKANSLINYVKSRNKYTDIKLVSSLVEAIDAINAEEFGLILIDMALPSHPIFTGGGSPISLLTGGIDVLLELNSIQRRDPCIVITQYPDIEICGEFYPLEKASEEIEHQLGCNVLACIAYTEGDESWKMSLDEILDKNEDINS